MQIKEAMTKEIRSISSTATVKDAALLMKQSDVGALPVMEQGGLSGMITDRDIVVRAIAEGSDPNSILVKDIMSTDVLTCREDQPLEEVASLMESKKVRRIVVLNRKNEPAGIISLGDLAAHAQRELAGEALKQVSEPVHSK